MQRDTLHTAMLQTADTVTIGSQTVTITVIHGSQKKKAKNALAH